MIQQQQLRNHYPHVEDDHDIIGLEEHTKTLQTELMKDDERRYVVSIVGVGGLGKTTLAKKIYKHDIVMSRFDCHAWSSISQQFNPGDSLLQLIKTSMNLGDNELNRIKELSMRDLVGKLYLYLQDKRYFVVLDDLWSFEDWNTLSPAFPNGKRGSKVLLTTRNKEVASQVDPWSLQLEPHLLNDEDSWELLCKKAFPKNMRDVACYPTNLEKLGKDMVRKCGGLPLAICVLGGILATKRAEIKEWEYVNRNFTSNINKGKNGGVMGILELSYNDLPVHLKPCFLYLSLSPEDYVIPRKKLIQLWIAEGFILHMQEDALVTPEDIGKNQYYAELIQRCMIQPDKDTNPWRKKACRMHDLMRDLCLLKAKEMNFSDVYNDHNDGITLNSSRTDTCRRLRRYSLHLNDQAKRYDNLYFNNSTCALRTLLVNNPRGNPLAPLQYQNIILLQVLDLENAKNFSTNITQEVMATAR
ncbi:disease resistance protein RPP8-like [Papaver somniferum]|uniref:disease resistance protein RPP8-like n=1 Tax=Papaver somniferum TaxID=3469 RepID=UPI000E6F5725|nr:disease resistance protein RPP8-like [Papaver somniferum]